jgi:3-hydroxybutyryl-CoA dehydrogenase
MSITVKTPYSIRLGVVGAGTMGSGIALAALYTHMTVTLYDISLEMLEQAESYFKEYLKRKGKLANLRNLQMTDDLENMRGAGVVIEAVPEDLDLKKEIFSRLDEICPPPAILATNTSTLAVSAIAAATQSPQRVAGLHFFNPAPVLPLVEIIRAAWTNADSIQSLGNLANLLGKTPVIANDSPGFIVNRVARPFYGEALRLLSERVASHEDIDRLVRMGGGFRMGPFELMDLIGIDVNFAATQSMYDQTFGEPRYRPVQLQRRMLQQGFLGRKSGQGFYDYEHGGVSEDPKPPQVRNQTGEVLVSTGDWAPGLQDLCVQAGYHLEEPLVLLSRYGGLRASGKPVAGIVQAGNGEGFCAQLIEMDRILPHNLPLFCQCAQVTLEKAATWAHHPERLVGFDGLFLSTGKAATLVASPDLNPDVRRDAEAFIHSLGRHAVWIQDSPGLVLPRIVSMLANEAAFAVAENVTDPETIDQAMQLGANYPEGPLVWARKIGLSKIIAVLDHLKAEYGEERYRCSPLLRRWERQERIGRH